MRAVKFADLFFGIGVVEAEHRNAMRDLRESLERFATDALGRRIGSAQSCGKRFSRSTSSR